MGGFRPGEVYSVATNRFSALGGFRSGGVCSSQTWGFSWLSWTLYKHTGLIGLRLFNGLCASGALLLLYQAARNRKAQPKAIAFAIFFAAGMLIQNLGVRSQTWAFPLFASLVWIVSKPRPLRSRELPGALEI